MENWHRGKLGNAFIIYSNFNCFLRPSSCLLIVVIAACKSHADNLLFSHTGCCYYNFPTQKTKRVQFKKKRFLLF